MPLDEKLPDRLLQTYLKCIASEDVTYYPSEIEREANELRTEIRLCEALANKPGPPPSQMKSAMEEEEGEEAEELTEQLKEDEKEEKQEKKKKTDVFAPENWDDLFVDEIDGGLGETYGVLLNKYAVVPLHFLMVTRHWEHQTAPLTPPQLTAAYQIISAFANTLPHTTPQSFVNATSEHPPGTASNPLVGGDLLCFFNCGDASGASQEHKHLQFAPMNGEGSLGFFPIERAAQDYQFPTPAEQNKPFSVDVLPYAHHIRRLDPPPCPHPETATPEQLRPLMNYLQGVYLSLLDAMVDNLRFLHDSDPEGVPADKLKLGRGGLSYNMLFTRKHMHLIPRREAIFPLEDVEDADDQVDTDKEDPSDSDKEMKEPAVVACNSLAYTGTVLVKSVEYSKLLKERGGVLGALKHCGYSKSDRSMPNVEHEVHEE